YEQVLSHNRLKNGQVWPIPITLDVNKEFAEKVIVGDEITLCNLDNFPVARMTITDKWKPDKFIEAQEVFGTQDTKHPGVHYLLNKAGDWYLGGPVQLIQLPKH